MTGLGRAGATLEYRFTVQATSPAGLSQSASTSWRVDLEGPQLELRESPASPSPHPWALWSWDLRDASDPALDPLHSTPGNTSCYHCSVRCSTVSSSGAGERAHRLLQAPCMCPLGPPPQDAPPD